MSDGKYAIWNGNRYPVEKVKEFMRAQLLADQNTVNGQDLWDEVKRELADAPSVAGEPLPKEPEWKVEMVRDGLGIQNRRIIEIVLEPSNDPKSEAIKEAIEALMEYVYAEGGSEYPTTNQNAPMLAIKKARTLIQKGKDDE